MAEGSQDGQEDSIFRQRVELSAQFCNAPGLEVERRVEYKENEWLPCDESGRIDDGYGNEPNATVAYLSSLEGSREERAFELAKNEYLAWLEHKADRYTTVYGYMD